MLNIKSSELVQKAPFKDLNLRFGDKGLVFICGKKESSAKNLIKYIGGIEYLPGLNIQIDDFVLDDVKKLDDYRLHNIGFIFGNVQYIENETVLANVLSSSSLFAEVLDDAYVDECLDKVGLLEHKNCLVSELSEYQLHCLDIARALVKDPKVLLANNPIARLNQEEIDKIWNIIEKLSNEYLVIVGNALRAKAKEIANTIVSFEANEINHVLIENVEVISNVPYKEQSNAVTKHYEKTNQFSFKNLFKISSSLLKGGIFLICLLTITITLFLMSTSATNNAHKNFAETLYENNVHKVIMMRNTERTDFVISEEVRNKLDQEFPELAIQWGYYLGNDVSKIYPAHSKATNYVYPESLFKIGDDEKNTTYKLVYGSWDDSETGVYISESEAAKYIEYINKFHDNTLSHAKPLVDLYNSVYPEEGISFGNIQDLVGEKLLFAYNTKNLNVLKVAGIFKDNLYSNNLVATENYSFPSYNPDNSSFDESQFFSIGVVTLTNDITLNTEFLNYNATIIRNERESLLIKTDLDADYEVLYSQISSLVTPLNISALIFVVLTIAGSVIYSALLIANYRKELTLSRTYGLKKCEIIKISTILNLIIALIAVVVSIIITIIIQVIYNIVLKGKYAFLALSYFSIPAYAILIAILGAIVFAAVFIVLSIKALKQNDYLVY